MVLFNGFNNEGVKLFKICLQTIIEFGLDFIICEYAALNPGKLLNKLTEQFFWISHFYDKIKVSKYNLGEINDYHARVLRCHLNDGVKTLKLDFWGRSMPIMDGYEAILKI